MNAESIQALFVVIDDPDKLDQVLEVWLECEIRGATIIETQGMAKVLSDHVPIFFGLRSLMANEREGNRTSFTLSRHNEHNVLPGIHTAGRLRRRPEMPSGPL